MAALPTALTLEQFRELDLGEKPHLEFWYGEAIRKPWTTFTKALFQTVLMQVLARQSVIALANVRVHLGRDAELVPDLMVTKRLPVGDYPTEPFELAVEIRLPEQPMPWLTKKARYYIAQGVKHVWIIDPEARTAWMFSQQNIHGEWIPFENSLVVGSVELPLEIAFTELDRTVGTLEN